MRDELRDKIETIMHDEIDDARSYEIRKAGKEILPLIEGELAKASFLDDIIKRVDDKGCYEGGWCVLADVCDGNPWAH